MKRMLKKKVRVTKKKSPRRGAKKKSAFWFYIGLIAVAVLLIAGTAGLVLKNQSETKQKREAMDKKKQEGPLVETAIVKKGPTERTLLLEGEARPYFETTLYAKVSGYLRNIRVDEGSQVKKGDLIAVVDSPETDQAYVAAKSDAVNKQRIANRYVLLQKKDLVSAQEAEQAYNAANMANANRKNAAQQRQYEFVRAPFDGVITERFLDPGDLVANSSNSRSQSQALVTISSAKKLKVAAYLDQKYATQVRVGLPVMISLPDRTNEQFRGVVARVGGSLDPRTRMLLVEVDFDNLKGSIMPGSFVQFEIRLPLPGYPTAPVEALLSMNGKSTVAEILPNSHLKFHPVEVAENDGTTLSLSSGAQVGWKLAKNIGVNLKDGDIVRPVGGQANGTGSGASAPEAPVPVISGTTMSASSTDGAQTDTPSKTDAASTTSEPKPDGSEMSDETRKTDGN